MIRKDVSYVFPDKGLFLRQSCSVHRYAGFLFQTSRIIYGKTASSNGCAPGCCRYLQLCQRSTGRRACFVGCTYPLFGLACLCSISSENEILEVGYSLSREYWNQGYMTEALAEVIRYSFTQLPVHRLEAMHETTNPASGRVMEKCGMIQEGMMRGRVWNKTHFSDVMMYGITREQYEHP